MTLREQVNHLVDLGYKRLAAQAKVAHDVVLLAMHRSGFKSKSAIKGGVVMSSITRDIRRATMDMDIDFVHHSIANRSIEQFVSGLNKAIENIEVTIEGSIIDLKHEDYRGKRIYIAVTDESLSNPLRTKIDIGVHTHDELAQIEYSFEVFSDNYAQLQVNSNEQIFVEKLLSLLRHGILSHRPKDIFDMYYLSSQMDREKAKLYMEILVYASKRCKAKSKEDVLVLLMHIFSSSRYMAKLKSARVNWLDVSPTVATQTVLDYIASL